MSVELGPVDSASGHRGACQPPRACAIHVQVKRTVRNAIIFSTLFSQLMLAVFTPAFVVCQEGSGTQVLEFILSNCCVVDTPQSDGVEQVRDQDDCGGCEDAALVVSLKHDEGARSVALSSAVFTIDHAAWSWEACASPQPAQTPSPWPDGELTALRTVNLRC